MARWIQHPITHKLIPADEYERPSSKTAYIQGDIEGFISPVDGSYIDDRRKLRDHNKAHGVTDTRDYSTDHFEKKAAKNADKLTGETAKGERISTILQAMQYHEERK